MTHFGDNLHLGGARGTPSIDGGFGIGPCGRVYEWDTVPLALNASNIAGSQTPTGASNLTLAAGTGTTSVVNGRGETVIQLDVPRAIRVTQAGAGTQRNFTVTGYDRYGQKMSEVITSSVGSTANGKKAFFQVLSIAVSGATTTACNVGTNDVLGVPVAFTDIGYIQSVKWKGVLAQDAGTAVVADATDPATNATGDVRGTYQPSDATDGSKRLVMTISLPAIASGPDATRKGGFGVTQDLGTT